MRPFGERRNESGWSEPEYEDDDEEEEEALASRHRTDCQNVKETSTTWTWNDAVSA